MSTRISRYLPVPIAALSVCCTDAAGRPGGGTAAETPYNILLVLADDIGCECIGAYGSTYSTPNLDALAEEGMLYTNCYAQPLSTPTRVQLMTGKYNFRNYVEFGYMNPDETTFGNLARDSGYRTCMVGKWQLGADKSLPKKFGFDEYCLWQLEKGKKDGAGSRYAGVYIESDTDSGRKGIDTYGPDVFNQRATRFIEENRDRPFFLYYSDVLVHSPFNPTPDSGNWADEGSRKTNDASNFPDMVAYMDKNVGKLVGTLKRLDLYDRTVIIFIGDNGTNRKIRTFMKDGSSIRGGKGLMTDAGTHVPMIVRYPGGCNGVTEDALVDMTDFFPTVAEIAGCPNAERSGTDGHSLVPQFRGDSDAFEREWIFCHYDPLVNGVPGMEKSGRFIRTDRYKLYHDGRFFDIQTDPEEMNPLEIGAGDEDAERARAFLSGELAKFPAWKPGDRGAEKKGDYSVANKRNKLL